MHTISELIILLLKLTMPLYKLFFLNVHRCIWTQWQIILFVANLEKGNCPLWNEAVGQSSTAPGCEAQAKLSPALAPRVYLSSTKKFLPYLGLESSLQRAKGASGRDHGRNTWYSWRIGVKQLQQREKNINTGSPPAQAAQEDTDSIPAEQ